MPPVASSCDQDAPRQHPERTVQHAHVLIQHEMMDIGAVEQAPRSPISAPDRWCETQSRACRLLLALPGGSGARDGRAIGRGRTCRVISTERFYCWRVSNPSGDADVAVVVPFESHPSAIDRPAGRACRARHGARQRDDPVAHRLRRHDDPGGRQPPDHLGRQAAAADADARDGAALRLSRATATSSSRPRSSSCTPRRCCMTTWSTRATCGAASSRRACCGATRRACWSATSCSARPSG